MQIQKKLKYKISGELTMTKRIAIIGASALSFKKERFEIVSRLFDRTRDISASSYREMQIPKKMIQEKNVKYV